MYDFFFCCQDYYRYHLNIFLVAKFELLVQWTPKMEIIYAVREIVMAVQVPKILVTLFIC